MELLSPGRYMGPSGQIELVNKASPDGKKHAEDDKVVREQIEQIVRKQLAEQETQEKHQ
jgi:hypothetical protein